MAKRVTERIEELVGQLVAGLGYELDEVEYKKEGQDYVLTLYIDAPNGVTLEDCENVSRAVEPVIDEADPIEQAYYLSVSSIGLDRPLKKPRDFARNIGKPITVKLYTPVYGKKEFTGVLAAAGEELITLVADDGELEFDMKNVAQAKPYIDFK